MLSDKHFKVLKYEQDSSKVFTNTDIKGGVAITCRNERKEGESIGTFTHSPELNEIKDKVLKIKEFSSFSSLVYSPESYKFSNKLHEDYPNLRYHENNGRGSQ